MTKPHRRTYLTITENAELGKAYSKAIADCMKDNHGDGGSIPVGVVLLNADGVEIGSSIASGTWVPTVDHDEPNTREDNHVTMQIADALDLLREEIMDGDGGRRSPLTASVGRTVTKLTARSHAATDNDEDYRGVFTK